MAKKITEKNLSALELGLVANAITPKSGEIIKMAHKLREIYLKEKAISTPVKNRLKKMDDIELIQWATVVATLFAVFTATTKMRKVDALGKKIRTLLVRAGIFKFVFDRYQKAK